MGLLAMPGRFLTTLIFAAALAGCSELRLQRGVHEKSGDWTMYGGSIGRTNVSDAVVTPPLAPVWEFDASAGFSPYSVALADSYVFVGNLQGEVRVIGAAGGKGLGSFDFGSAIVGTPVVDGSTMFVALAHDDQSLVSYDLISGTVNWQIPAGDIETSPLRIGNRLYVTTLHGKLLCVDKGSGQILWKYQIPPRVRTRLIHSSPASDGTLVVFGSDNGDLYAVDAGDGTFRWSVHVGSCIDGSPSVSGGRAFIGALDGNYSAVDLNTGHIAWSRMLDGPVFSSQAVTERSVYVGTAGRTVYCLNSGTGEITWTATVGNVVNSSPLVTGEVVYTGCIDKTLYAFSAGTGEVLWKSALEGRIKTMPVASGDRLYVLAEDRSVIAMEHVSAP